MPDRTPPAVGSAAPPSPLALNLRAVWARAYVRVVGSVRDPAWIMSDAVFPALTMASFVLLYRALGAPRSFETLAVLGGILMTTTRAVFAIGIGFGLLGVRVAAFDGIQLLLVFVVTMTALYALGMALASLFLLYGREAWHVCNALQEPVIFLSGLYFPIRALGAIGSLAAGLVPLGLGVDAMRQVLLGEAAHGLLPEPIEASILAVLAVVFFVLARASLAYLEKLSKREGRLTQRWQ